MFTINHYNEEGKLLHTISNVEFEFVLSFLENEYENEFWETNHKIELIKE